MHEAITPDNFDIEVDGAHEGILPIQALRFATGSEPLAPGDRHSKEDMEKLVRETPLPTEDDSLFNPGTEATADDFNNAALCLAHIYLDVIENDDIPLEGEGAYTEEEVLDFVREAHPEWLESPTESTPNYRGMIGEEKAKDHNLFIKGMDKYPYARLYMGGITPYMAGWSYNVIRWILGAGPADNAGITTVEVENE